MARATKTMHGYSQIQSYICIWFECPKMDSGMTNIKIGYTKAEIKYHLEPKRTVWLMSYWLKAIWFRLITWFEKSGINIWSLWFKNTWEGQINTNSPWETKNLPEKVWKRCGRWEFSILLLVRMNFMQMEGNIASEDVPKYQFVFQLFVALRHVSTQPRDLQDIRPYPTQLSPKNQHISPPRLPPPPKPGVFHLCSSRGRDFLQGLRHTQRGLEILRFRFRDAWRMGSHLDVALEVRIND